MLDNRLSISARDLAAIALATALIAPLAFLGHAALGARVDRRGITLSWPAVAEALAWTAGALALGILLSLLDAAELEELEDELLDALPPSTDPLESEDEPPAADAAPAAPPLSIKRKEAQP